VGAGTGLTLIGVETRATFRLWGSAGRTAEAVTHRLGVRPTRAIEAGAPVGRRSAHVRDSSTWLLSASSGIETGVELATQLDRLLVILEPVTPLLWGLVEAGYEATGCATSPPMRPSTRSNLTGRFCDACWNFLEICGSTSLAMAPMTRQAGRLARFVIRE